MAAIHTHSTGGAGSPATPSEPMYRCAHAASAAPLTTITGNHRTRQDRDRPPTANSSTTAVTICTAAGSQPWINDKWPM